MEAIRIIREERESLAAVMHGLVCLVRGGFVDLFRRTVNLAPPPFGVGPTHA